MSKCPFKNNTCRFSYNDELCTYHYGCDDNPGKHCQFCNHCHGYGNKCNIFLRKVENSNECIHYQQYQNKNINIKKDTFP